MINCLLIDPAHQVAAQLNNLLAQTTSFRLSTTMSEPQSVSQLAQYGPYMPVFCVHTSEVKVVLNSMTAVDTNLLILLSEDNADAALAYDYDAIDFLPLPLVAARLQRCLDKIMRFSQYTANTYVDVLPKLRDLTKTERTVLRNIGEQKTTRQIADQLFVSEKTINTHRNNIRSKLEFEDRRPLTPFAQMVVNQRLLEKYTH